jgi:hypothetical protein
VELCDTLWFFFFWWFMGKAGIATLWLDSWVLLAAFTPNRYRIGDCRLCVPHYAEVFTAIFSLNQSSIDFSCLITGRGKYYESKP